MNTVTSLIAKHLREVHVGVNWSWSNVRDQLEDITLEEATTQVYDLNTIATLAFHIHYYIAGVTEVLHNRPLVIKDKFAFDHPPFENEEEWKSFVNRTLNAAENFAQLIEKLDDEILPTVFVEEKYGNYFRNLVGIIEHCHYHLGQIAIIKKILRHGK
jgi:hypothetical protein